jgi:hypothetical protein
MAGTGGIVTGGIVGADGNGVGSGELETSGLDVTPGTGGGGGVPGEPGAVWASEAALVPNATVARAANANVRRFNGTPRD